MKYLIQVVYNHPHVDTEHYENNSIKCVNDRLYNILEGLKYSQLDSFNIVDSIWQNLHRNGVGVHFFSGGIIKVSIVDPLFLIHSEKTGSLELTLPELIEYCKAMKPSIQIFENYGHGMNTGVYLDHLRDNIPDIEIYCTPIIPLI